MTDRSGGVSPLVALLTLVARLITIAGWPAIIVLTLTLVIAVGINPITLPLYAAGWGVLFVATLLALTDWHRRHMLTAAEWIRLGQQEARAHAEALRAHFDQRLNSMTNILVEHGIQPGEQQAFVIPGDNVLAFDLGRQVGRDSNNGSRKPH